MLMLLSLSSVVAWYFSVILFLSPPPTPWFGTRWFEQRPGWIGLILMRWVNYLKQWCSIWLKLGFEETTISCENTWHTKIIRLRNLVVLQPLCIMSCLRRCNIVYRCWRQVFNNEDTAVIAWSNQCIATYGTSNSCSFIVPHTQLFVEQTPCKVV